MRRSASGGTATPTTPGRPAYLNKQLWNQVVLEGAGAPDADEAHELIDDSYALVVASLPKSKRPSG